MRTPDSSNAYNVFIGENFPKTYLVVDSGYHPRNVVPSNLLYLFGDLSLTRNAVNATHLPFAPSGRKKITSCVEEWGFCFYRWPGRILGATLGDILEVQEDARGACDGGFSGD
jgi:hypothetical protein